MTQPTKHCGISLIVCTRNHLPSFKATIDSLRALTCRQTWELVLVDNGSTDGTGDWLSSLQAVSDARVVIASEPRAGLSRARNVGLARASGRIIAFTDDDCYPTPSYLDDILEAFADEALGYLGGRVLLHDPLDLPITIKTSTEPEAIPPRSFLAAGVIHGANMALRKVVCDSVGEFDVLLGAGAVTQAGEDVEYLSRASWLGWAGAYMPVPTVRHHHRRREPEDRITLEQRYDLGRGAYYMKSLLRRESRLVTLKFWCLESWPKEGLPGRLIRELRGALTYLWCRLLHIGA